MAGKVNLDAMIPRADFATEVADNASVERISTISVEQLNNTSLLVHRLRKPDFQRETNHWSADQYMTFLKSYLDNELVPSVILWQSPSDVFVIDGGHRISALRAWVEDDYGDGHISHKFYRGVIPEDQKKIAQRLRKKIENEIGTYARLKSLLIDPDEFADELQKRRARNVATRSLSLQWVEGDAEKAETSFFKINTQGTPLHKTEERLLRERRKPIAIAARSIVRAGTGHKYWSKFADETKKRVEEAALELNTLLFQPELKEPIKTLDLPLGGQASPIGALNLLMDLVEVACREQGQDRKKWRINADDLTGEATVEALRKCTAILKRITGNEAGSLGLHPAIYFYNHRGKHSDHLFLAVVGLFSEAVLNNDGLFFKSFILARSRLERFLKENKALINQAIVQIGSGYRVSRLRDMFKELIKRFEHENHVSPEELLSILGLEGKLVAAELTGSSSKFSQSTKSAIYLRQSLEAAVCCPICKGYIDTAKSASFDHVDRVRDGGAGIADNGQLTHPYCNSAIKN